VVLCIFFALIILSIDLWQFYKKHKYLTKLQGQIISSIDNLPSPKNLLEKDYYELIHLIHEDKTRLLSAADNAKSNLIDYYTLWAHQIKTPIAAMNLLLQINEHEFDMQLKSELFKIEQYVEMVLTYLRLDSASTDFVIKQYDLSNILKQAIRKYAHMFIQKQISLNLAEINCTVLTDEKWLLFVIEQVLSNALKYTNKGKISIYCETNKTLIIKDTGIGIAAEDLPRVFEKGFTGYNGRNDKKSTGIGLYLCKRTFNKLGHTIVIESTIGVGTEVKIGLDAVNITIE
jgi:signal transduction histidine kinase